MENLPFYLPVFFLATVLLSLAGVYFMSRSFRFLALAITWAVFQSILGLSGFYQDYQSLPPRILVFGVLPAILLMVIVFSTAWGRSFLNGLNLRWLTLFHAIRVPVEITLAALAFYGMVPTLMTFEGINFDIFSGLTAPIIALWVFKGKKSDRKALFSWNILCLILLLIIVITAIFSAPFPFQRFAFEQPNIGVLYFPFNLLPSLIVPLVLFAHLASIWKIILEKQELNVLKT